MTNTIGGFTGRFCGSSLCRRVTPGARRVLFGTFCLSAACTVTAATVLSFDRLSDNHVSTTGRVSTLDFTIESWVRQTVADTENQIYAQDNGSTGRIFFSIWGGRPTLQVSGTRQYAATNLTLNAWHHFAATRDTAGYVRMYLDGQLVHGPAYYNKDLPATSANTLTSIGLLLRAKNGFRGDLAELRLWNIERTQLEIQSDMNRRAAGSEIGLVHCWPLDEGSGTTAFDRAGSADGLITGAAWSTRPDLPIVSDLPSGSWISAAGGDWATAANWLDSLPAQGVGATAYFTNQPPAAITVHNNMAGLALGTLAVNGTHSHTFTGNTITLTNATGSAAISTDSGAHTLALQLATTASGLSIATLAPGAFTVGGVISGSGALAVNPAGSGGGTVTLAAANTFAAPLTLGCGTLAVALLADGGQPSAIGAASGDPANLILGPGTLRYTGPAVTIDRGLTANAGVRKAALLSVDTSLTLTGPITNAAGALIKTGPGTLIYASPAASLIGRQQSAGITTQAPYPANGDAPANGFGCFTVAGGKVILGAHPAQTNLFQEEVTVGAYTTDQAGQEVTAELECVGGYHRFNNYLDIGYYNGTSVTAPTPLQPTLTVSGGTISADKLIIAFGYHTNQNTHAVLNISGGTMTVDNEIRFGDQRGDPDSPMLATINLSGGEFRHVSTTAGLRMGWRFPAADAALNITGGLFEEYADVMMAQNGNTSTLYLGGGILRMRNITHNSVTGTSRLTFDGGVLQPRAAGYTLRGLSTAHVSTGGARIDTSLAPYTITQDLLHDPLGATPDGGLVKTGAHPLTLAFTNATYSGTTAVQEGELRIGGNGTQTVAVAALTVASGAAVGFTFTADGSSNDRLYVAASPAFAAGSLVALTLAGTELPFTKNGTYTLLTYSAADSAVSGLACAAPAPGKTYAFAASAGAVTVTIGDGDAVWGTDADGAWSTAANWTAAPLPGGPARFDDVISAPRTVTTAGQTASGLFFNNANTYTLGGSGLTLSSGATLAVEQGAHAVEAPLTLADSAAVTLAPGSALTLGPLAGTTLTAQGNGTLTLAAAPALAAIALDVPALNLGGSFTVASPVALARTTTVAPADNAAASLSGTLSGNAGLTKSGASTLTLSGLNTYSGATRIDNGTLTAASLADGGQPSAIGAAGGSAADLVIGPGTFRYSGPGMAVQRGLTLAAPQNRAAIIRIEEASDLTLTGPIASTSGAFIKTGPGTLRLAQPNGANKLMTHGSPNETARLNIGPNGESPTQGFSGVSVVDGTLTLGAPGQTNTLSRIFVGLFSSDLPGGETAGELVITDGILNLNGTLLAVGRNNGTATTAPGGLASRLTVSGGLITNANHLSLGYQNAGLSGYNARPVMEMSGGTVVINNFFISESSGAKSTVTLTGGTVRALVSARFAMAANTEALFTLDGDALFETVGAFDTQLGYNNSATAVATLRLNGGTLSTRNIVKAASAQGTLSWNGGTLRPHTAGQTLQNLTAVQMSTNGAVIDTSLAAYTVAQDLLTDPALAGAADGGLLKLGAHALGLTGSGNTFRGPVRVNAGLLRARLGGTNDLAVAEGAAFDALGERCTVGALTGTGTLSNGVIAVVGTLDPGTNGAPAGAAMTVQHLALTEGAVVACPWSTNSLGQITCDRVTVTGSLTVEGPGRFDLGRTEAAPIPMPFSQTVMTYGSFSGTFAGWKAVNTGLPEGKATTTLVETAAGQVTLHVRYSGTLLLVQ